MRRTMYKIIGERVVLSFQFEVNYRIVVFEIRYNLPFRLALKSSFTLTSCIYRVFRSFFFVFARMGTDAR